MSNYSGLVVREQVGCRVCGHQFTFEALIDKNSSFSKDVVKGKVIVTGSSVAFGGRVLTLDVHADCPNCNVTNLYEHSIKLKTK
jgi:uncharacterized protein (DUF983 family)